MKKYALELSMTETGGNPPLSTLDEEWKREGIDARRDAEWIILESEEDLQRAMDVLDRRQIEYEDWPVIQLPEQTSISPDFDGIGFALSDGTRYVFAELAAAYALQPGDGPDSDPASAQMQLEEHVSASYPTGNGKRHVVSAHLRELVEGVAKAYGCTVQWGWL